MAELIDRAALLKALDYARTHNIGVRDAVKSVPIIDAEPVVRCKECKHCAMHQRYPLCKLGEEYTEPDAFCSRGQRRKRMDADAPERVGGSARTRIAVWDNRQERRRVLCRCRMHQNKAP